MKTEHYMASKYYTKKNVPYELPGWLARVEKEREELLTRLLVLKRYMESDAFGAEYLGDAQRILLNHQYDAMERYFDILTVRYELGLKDLENGSVRKASEPNG